MDFIQQALETEKENIVIDLRKNFGGSMGNIALIYQWLTDKPFHVDKKYELKDPRKS